MIVNLSSITTAEDAQSLIRQLQEVWLFGQLNTLEDSKAQRQTDEDAKAIAGLLQQLTQLQQGTVTDGLAASNKRNVAVNGA
ncbi:hypothetical protein LTR78_003941 [Recurvomyces mirabilis]|uniref:Uncharacterized protein n=1 Tax=Recurvomyces mirabilis TaxID=574656 RepID=A0AAE0WQU5_9PEZI|nr:hypothetical protein LTR78_003941 [Recurvomyces mirabilis]KAK5153921.1 hypothetical protein LTS14_007141 [Recurvomyces mirabilis]